VARSSRSFIDGLMVDGSGKHPSQIGGLLSGEHGTSEVVIVLHPHLHSVSVSGGLDVQLRATNLLDSHQVPNVSMNPTRIMAPTIPHRNTNVFRYMI